jgi:hypothetical protein
MATSINFGKLNSFIDSVTILFYLFIVFFFLEANKLLKATKWKVRILLLISVKKKGLAKNHLKK